MTPSEIIGRVSNSGDGWYWVRVSWSNTQRAYMTFAYIGYIKRLNKYVATLRLFDDVGDVEDDLVYGLTPEPDAVVLEMRDVQEPF